MGTTKSAVETGTRIHELIESYYEMTLEPGARRPILLLDELSMNAERPLASLELTLEILKATSYGGVHGLDNPIVFGGLKIEAATFEKSNCIR